MHPVLASILEAYSDSNQTSVMELDLRRLTGFLKRLFCIDKILLK